MLFQHLLILINIAFNIYYYVIVKRSPLEASLQNPSAVKYTNMNKLKIIKDLG